MPDAPTPETGTPAAPATPVTPPEPATPDSSKSKEPIKLPDDHPLVKAYADTKAKLKKREDAELSETERLTNELGTESERANNAESRVALLEAAMEHGLSKDDLALLGTGAPDEIAARAEALAKRLAGSEATRKKNGARVPGEGRSSTPTDNDLATFARDLFNTPT